MMVLMLKAISLSSFVVMVIAILGLFAVDSLFSPSGAVIGVQGLAVALMIWARVSFGVRSFHATANPTEGGLVTTGPYRFIRHPIYTAGCLFAGAGILAHPSLRALGLGLLLFLGALVRMLCGERLVMQKYSTYRDYARVTKRMVPYIF